MRKKRTARALKSFKGLAKNWLILSWCIMKVEGDRAKSTFWRLRKWLTLFLIVNSTSNLVHRSIQGIKVPRNSQILANNTLQKIDLGLAVRSILMWLKLIMGKKESIKKNNPQWYSITSIPMISSKGKPHLKNWRVISSRSKFILINNHQVSSKIIKWEILLLWSSNKRFQIQLRQAVQF